MKEAIIAKAYAKSIYELGQKSNIDITKELTLFTEVINESNDLETLLFLDVFTIEEKEAVLKEIFHRLETSNLARNTISFLLEEKRIALFPLLFKELVVIDDHEKGFLRGRIEGAADEAPKEIVEELTAYLAKKLNSRPVLTYKKNKELTAGYRVTVEDLQLDATLDNQLDKLKSEILNS